MLPRSFFFFSCCLGSARTYIFFFFFCAAASRERESVVSALRHWFLLYPVLNVRRGHLHTFMTAEEKQQQQKQQESQQGASSSNGLDEQQERVCARRYVAQLYGAVDEFLMRSSVGELPTRMTLVHAFAARAAATAAASATAAAVAAGASGASAPASASDSDARAREDEPLPAYAHESVSHTLAHLLQYYKQFLPLVFSSVAKKKQVLADRLRDQIKLHTWDLSNYWSLKDSSAKSHQKLHKFSSDYQEVTEAVLQRRRSVPCCVARHCFRRVVSCRAVSCRVVPR
jgi:hypothetical protein